MCKYSTVKYIIKYLSQIICKWKNKFSNEQHSCEILRKQKYGSTTRIGKRENSNGDVESQVDMNLLQ